MGLEIGNVMTDDIKERIEHYTNMTAKSSDINDEGLGGNPSLLLCGLAAGRLRHV